MTAPAILGLAGTSLGPRERALFAARPPLGVILFARNITDAAGLRTLLDEVRDLLPGVRIMVDQEGGRVARLRPPHWRAHPPAGAIGAIAGEDRARRAAYLHGAAIGLECARAGFDLVAAPVLDLALPGADAVIGDRGFGADPARVAALGRAMADGLLSAGVQPVAKHAPGHGGVGADSHHALPELDSVDPAHLAPFAALAPVIGWMMTAHVLYRAQDPARPATVSPALIEGVIRGRIGFAGVLVSDDLAMRALAGTPLERARACLAAGCDLALECSGDPDVAEALLDGLPDLAPGSAERIARAEAARRRVADTTDFEAVLAERAGLLR